MYKKFFFLFVIFNFVSQCGFTPLYSNKSNMNFSIDSIELKGDRTINNYLKINLNQYENDQYNKKFKIEIQTTFIKQILSKDKAANTTNYELSSNSIIKISLSGKLIKELNIAEKKIVDDIDDNFEEQKNERVTKQTFASSITNKLLTELSMLNDN